MSHSHGCKALSFPCFFFLGIFLMNQSGFSQGNRITVPKSELWVLSDVPVHWKGIGFKAVPHNGKAPGAKALEPWEEITNHTGKAKTYDMDDKSAIGYRLTWAEAVDVSGNAGISGKASGSIKNPRGWIKCMIRAKSLVKYADQKVLAEGKDGFALTTDGNQKTIGGGVTIKGYGASLTVSWVQQEEGHVEKAAIGDIDSGLTRLTKEAVVNLQAFVKGSMYLEDQAVGNWEAEAEAGALIEAKAHPQKVK